MLEGVKKHSPHVNAFFVGALVFAGIILVLCAVNLFFLTAFPDKPEMISALISWWLPIFIILPPVAGAITTAVVFRSWKKRTSAEWAEEYKKELQSIRLSRWPSHGKLVNLLIVLGLLFIGALAFLGAGLFSLSGDSQAQMEKISIIIAIVLIYLGLFLVASLARKRSR